MAEEKRKVNSWVPISLWEKVEKLGYNSPTRAVCDGLELLVNGHNPDIHGHDVDTSGHVPDTEIESLKLEINRLKTDLQRNTENGEIIQLQARVEDLKGHNETLKKELEKAAQEKENLQNIYNNYMLQMQTLINQKAIEAPGEKKPWWKLW